MTKEVEQLFRGCRDLSPGVLQEQDIRGLPDPVQRCLRYAGVIGKERVHSVRLRQKGSIRLKPGQRWMPFKAGQYYTTNPPGFLWNARVKFGFMPGFRVRDTYYHGRGGMQAKLFSLFKVMDASGPELDQGAMLRYFNEVMWFPSAYLSEYIRWEAVDDDSARATMSYEGTTASATLHFSREGALTNFVARRYMTSGSEYRLETWSTPITGYGEFRGVRIPVRGSGVWNLSDGDFEYVRIEVTDIEYNNPSAWN